MKTEMLVKSINLKTGAHLVTVEVEVEGTDRRMCLYQVSPALTGHGSDLTPQRLCAFIGEPLINILAHVRAIRPSSEFYVDAARLVGDVVCELYRRGITDYTVLEVEDWLTKNDAVYGGVVYAPIPLGSAKALAADIFPPRDSTS